MTNRRRVSGWQAVCAGLLLAVGSSTPFMSAAEPKTQTVTDVVDGQLGSAESEVVSLAEAMPTEAYDFAPSSGEFKGVRTFAQQAKHIAAVNYLVAAAILGEKNPVPDAGEAGPATVTDKAAIVKYLKDSFAYTHKAMKSVTKDNLMEMIPSPFGSGKMSRLSAANITTWHTFDHYGQMAVYARMKGIVPPASRQ